MDVREHGCEKRETEREIKFVSTRDTIMVISDLISPSIQYCSKILHSISGHSQSHLRGRHQILFFLLAHACCRLYSSHLRPSWPVRSLPHATCLSDLFSLFFVFCAWSLLSAYLMYSVVASILYLGSSGGSFSSSSTTLCSSYLLWVFVFTEYCLALTRDNVQYTWLSLSRLWHVLWLWQCTSTSSERSGA